MADEQGVGVARLRTEIATEPSPGRERERTQPFAVPPPPSGSFAPSGAFAPPPRHEDPAAAIASAVVSALVPAIGPAVSKLSTALEESGKRPGGQPLGLVIGSAALFSLVFSIAAVWVHDQTTRGTVSGRLDDQDAAINGLIDTTSSLLDEEEASSEWLCEALAVGFGKPITCRSTRGVEKIRREMPRKIHHP